MGGDVPRHGASYRATTPQTDLVCVCTHDVLEVCFAKDKDKDAKTTVQGQPCGASASHATQGAFPQFGVVGDDLRDRG